MSRKETVFQGDNFYYYGSVLWHQYHFKPETTGAITIYAHLFVE